MVGSTGTLMTMRLVRSKLRKREESSSATPNSIEAQQTTFDGTFTSQSRTNSSGSNCSSIQHHQQQQQQQHIFTSQSFIECNNAANLVNTKSHSYNGEVTKQQQPQIAYRTSGGGNGVITNAWVFPPKEPTPNIYHCNNNLEALIAANDKHGFKGFRKQFSGRFKRLVAKKPQEPAPAIPPELKPQLKTIYVY